jgi:hypothetical protein
VGCGQNRRLIYATISGLSLYSTRLRSEGDLDPLRVIPANVRVIDLNELLDGCSPPVTRIEQLLLEPPNSPRRPRYLSGIFCVTLSE